MLLTSEDIDEILESIWCGKEIGSRKEKGSPQYRKTKGNR